MGWSLIADIGGTNARMAKADGAGFDTPAIYDSKAEIALSDRFAQFVAAEGTAPEQIIVAAAGTITDGAVKLTNANQVLSARDLMARTGAKDVRFLNDFEAAAWALAAPDALDVQALRGAPQPPRGHRIILGAGTGLGVGTLAMGTNSIIALPGEGGHVGLSPISEREMQVFSALIDAWPDVQFGSDLRIEAEAILSGTGLPYLYRALAQVEDVVPNFGQGAEIMAAAANGDRVALDAVQMFSTWLGRVAGDLAVTVLPYGGVFLTGGVLQANPVLTGAAFLDGFNAGGRFTALRESFPIYLCGSPSFGLLGAYQALKAT